MERFTLQAKDSVLLVIDIQEKLMKAMEQRDQLCKKTIMLLKVAEQFKIPVIVTEQYPKGLGSTVSDIASALPPDCRRVEKSSFNACSDQFRQVLAETGRHTVVVCGTETHVCVYQTVRSLLDLGYQVFVVLDAVCSRYHVNYRNGLQLMAAMGAVVITAEGVAFDLMKVAGTPEFKAISPLIK